MGHYERENAGTRITTYAGAYAETNRVRNGTPVPYLVFEFPSQAAALGALKELPFIHTAVDSGNLISSEMISFGYYAINPAAYHVILCGFDIAAQTWRDAKFILEDEGGRLLASNLPETPPPAPPAPARAPAPAPAPESAPVPQVRVEPQPGVPLPPVVVEAPAELPAVEAEVPAELPAVEAIAPAELPAVEEAIPAELPAVDVEAPAELPVVEVEAPAELPVVEVEAPAELPAVEVEPPAELPAVEVEVPAELPVVEVEAPAELPPVEPAPAPAPEAPPVVDDFYYVKEYQEYRDVLVNGTLEKITLTYRLYKADSVGAAMRFLNMTPVDRKYFYLVVETPEGNICRDINGIYKG